MSDLAFSLVTLNDLSDDEHRAVQALITQLDQLTPGNQAKLAYYEGTKRIRDLGIAIPPELRQIESVVGWPGIAVDVLEERLDWEGVVLPGGNIDDFGLPDIIRTNHVVEEQSLGHIDALIHGVAFLAVGTGRAGEPDPLITTESPLHMTAIWDRRARRISAALSRTWDAELGRTTAATLYLPDETIHMESSSFVNGWRVTQRDQHELGRVPVARLVNRPRAGNRHGRSEITRALRSYTDTGVRTMLGMEVTREFFSSPQRWIMGADEKAFIGPDGQPKTAWESYLGRWLALTRDEDGQAPQVGQFQASSPAPFIEQVKMLSQMVSAETAIPATQLGFVSDNPPSADSARVLEARLIKRAERRHTSLGAGRVEALRLAVLVRDGVLPAELDSLASVWRNPATPTPAAAADAGAKQIGTVPWLAETEVGLELLGLSNQQITRALADRRRQSGSAALRAIVEAAEQGRTVTGADSRPVPQ